MSKFKVGDKALCTFGKHKGEHRVIKKISTNGEWLQFEGKGFRNFNATLWELIEGDTSKRRPHYDLIIAWANGSEIQHDAGNDVWITNKTPAFSPKHNYRIKPDAKTEEISSIRKEMDKLASRLKELE